MVSKRSTNASTQTQCSEVLNKEDVDQRKPRTLEECIRISQNQVHIFYLLICVRPLAINMGSVCPSAMKREVSKM